MAQKKKTAKKKTPARAKKAPAASTRTQKKASPPPPPPAHDSGRGPVLILIIMLLVATVAFLLNRQYSGKIKLPFPLKDREKVAADRTDEKKQQVPETEKKSTDKKDDKKTGDKQKDPAKEEPVAKDVQIYLVSFNEKTEAVSLSSVKRSVTGTSPLDAALRELLKGPNASEKKKGMITAIPSGLRIRGVTVHDGIADIDFNERIEEGGAGNILLSRVDQIVYTATQFDTVKGVTIRVNGKKKKTLGADGLSVDGPLHRRR